MATKDPDTFPSFGSNDQTDVIPRVGGDTREIPRVTASRSDRQGRHVKQNAGKRFKRPSIEEVLNSYVTILVLVIVLLIIVLLAGSR
jgi:hypothetical protein